MKQFTAILFLLVLCLIHAAEAEVKFPWKNPGKAQIECSETSATLSNRMFQASFRKAGKGVVFDGLKTTDGKQVAGSGTNLFTIHLENGTTYTSKELSCGAFEEIKLKADKKHPQLACPRDTCPLIRLILASGAARHLLAHLPDTRQLSPATPACSSA